MVTVASLYQIIDYLGSLDSSRKLAPICQKGFINIFYLIILNVKISFDVTGAKKSLGKQIDPKCLTMFFTL